MKGKKALLTTTLLGFVGLSCILGTFAHSGRTDANGGHWDRKTGTYHYHSDGNAVQPYTYYNNSTPSDNVTSHEYIVTYNDRYDEGYDEGYSDGLTDGEDIYYDKGYNEGYETGHTEGYDEGYSKGYDRGCEEGYFEVEEEIEQQSLWDKFLMYYTPTSIVVVILLCIKAFSK